LNGALRDAYSLSAFADTFKLPKNKPIVSFILPESWKPTETDTGLEAVSVDGEIYLALEFVDADSVDDVIEANLREHAPFRIREERSLS
jgi:hypothetical protein